jgi:iron complex transport system substrate-binding protein
VSLSPNVTEILHGVGAFDRVVAVSVFCDYPPETANLPRVGTWQSTNLEQIQSLEPDLIAMTDGQAPFVKNNLDALGIRTLVVRGQSLDDVIAAIRQVGRAVGSEREGEELAARTRATLDEVRERTRGLNRPRVLCVVDRVPGTLRDLYTAAKGSYLDELITVAGGESIAPAADTGYGKVSKEAVAALDPDVIVDMIQGQKGAFAEDPQAVWRELPELKAVVSGRVYPIRETMVLHPSQFVADTARLFAGLFHPEVFGRDAPRP